MSKTPTLVLFAPYPPLPLTSGGSVRIFHTIKELSTQFTLSLFDFYRHKQNISSSSAFLDKLIINRKSYPLHKKSQLSFFIKGVPYWFSEWYDREIIGQIQKLSENPPDYIQVETTQLLYMGKYLPKGPKKIFVAYDISVVAFWRRLKEEHNPIKLIVKLWRLFEIYWYERANLPYFDTVVAASEDDKKALRRIYGLTKVVVVQNGIEKVDILPYAKERVCINLGYIGSFEHSPNLKAVQFFLSSIAPLLENHAMKFRYFLAGDNKKQVLDQLIAESPLQDKTAIINLGFVQNPEDFYEKIDVLVCPIFSGSGTRVKIVESLSYGRPVVTSKTGAEGIGIQTPYLNIVTEQDNINLWIKAIQSYSKYPIFGQKDEIKLVEQLEGYTWSIIFSNYGARVLSRVKRDTMGG